MGFLDEVRDTLGTELADIFDQEFFKVSTIVVNDEATNHIWESDIAYFKSLQEAKKVLKGRVAHERKSPFLAQPEEIDFYGINTGLLPECKKTIISNRDLPTFNEGRWKFFEIRYFVDGKICTIRHEMTTIIPLTRDLSEEPVPEDDRQYLSIGSDDGTDNTIQFPGSR